MSDDEIWTRRAGETSKAYEAFCAYRQMPPSKRSMRRLAEDTGRSNASIFDWASTWTWTGRVAAWDDYCDAVERQAQVEKLKEIGANRVDLALEFARAIRQKMVGDEEANITALDIDKLTAKDIVSMTDALVKLDRLSLEASGEIERDKPLEVKLSFELSPAAEIALEGAKQRLGTTKKAPLSVVESGAKPASQALVLREGDPPA